MADAQVKSCEECGASIYPEHIGTHKAGYWGGKLFCVHCYARRQGSQVTLDPSVFANLAAARAAATGAAGPGAAGPGAAGSGAAGPGAAGPGAAAAPRPAEPAADSPSTASGHPAPPAPAAGLSIGGGDDPRGDEARVIELGPAQAISMARFATPSPAAAPPAGRAAEAGGLKRRLHHDGKGATRCRVFHAKLNDGALQFMQDQINDWLDAHHDIEVKHVSTQVGTFEGKHSELHLIITVFY